MPKAQRRFFSILSVKGQASESLARVETLLEVMKLSRADFTTPQKLLEEARTLLAQKDYRGSLDSAEQAERLAKIIEERYRAAKQSLGTLKSEIKELEELGLDATVVKNTMKMAKQRIKEGTIEDGYLIPNYLEARVTAEDASRQARALISGAKETSDTIFTTQLAIDALKEMQGPIEQEVFEVEVLSRFEEMLQQSTQLLAEGKVKEALALADEVEERANSFRVDYNSCITGLESCENVMKELLATGAVADRAARLLDIGKRLLMNAKVAEARDSIVKAEREAVTVSDHYRRAIESIEEAKVALVELSKFGMIDPGAEKRLKDAQKALAEGKYLRALDLAEDSHRSVERMSELHDRLGRSLREMREALESMQEKGVKVADELEELLKSAERSYESGDYVTCSKEMKTASMLVPESDFQIKVPLKLLEEIQKQ